MRNELSRFWCVAVIFVALSSCSTPIRHSDPLANWSADLDHQPSQAIVDDYHAYIQSLPSRERRYAGIIHFFRDGKGGHAITIEIPLNNVRWRHVLIYDKEDKRIKVIKYASGRYAS